MGIDDYLVKPGLADKRRLTVRELLRQAPADRCIHEAFPQTSKLAGNSFGVWWASRDTTYLSSHGERIPESFKSPGKGVSSPSDYPIGNTIS